MLEVKNRSKTVVSHLEIDDGRVTLSLGEHFIEVGLQTYIIKNHGTTMKGNVKEGVKGFGQPYTEFQYDLGDDIELIIARCLNYDSYGKPYWRHIIIIN